MTALTNRPGHTEFTCYSEGLCYASSCTSLDDEAATAAMNSHSWGTTNGWHVADEPFMDGTPNGSPCPDSPDTHRHLLFVC